MSGMPWKKPLNSAAQTQQGVEALLLRLILLFARETGARCHDGGQRPGHVRHFLLLLQGCVYVGAVWT